jgi:hypothetical protein
MGLDEIANTNCNACTTLQNEAMQGFAAEHPDASQSDILYAGRMALMSRGHTAHRNYTDPRGFSRTGPDPRLAGLPPPEGFPEGK